MILYSVNKYKQAKGRITSLAATLYNKRYIIGIDIGGTNIRIGGVSPEHKVIDTPRIYSSRIIFATDDPVVVLDRLINQFISEYPQWTLAGICIGFPGTVSRSKDTVISCPNLLAFTNKNVAKPLQEKFRVPIIIEHDVILLLSYDMHVLQLEKADCIVSFYIGTGLGNAIYINGKFLEGKNGVAGELGHIPLYSKNEMCNCGNQGCIELFCCGKALERLHKKYLNKTSFDSIFSHYNDCFALQEFIDYMAMALATEINILDPTHIVLAGGVIRMEDFPLDDLYEKIHKYTRKPYPEQSLKFTLGSDDPCAGILGAGIYMWRKFT